VLRFTQPPPCPGMSNIPILITFDNRREFVMHGEPPEYEEYRHDREVSNAWAVSSAASAASIRTAYCRLFRLLVLLW
jgi:hypothetical protein